jgi:hypothetical protein
MRKSLFSLAMAVLVAGLCAAQTANAADNTTQTNQLLKQRTYRTHEGMQTLQDLTRDLTDPQKSLLYSEYKTDGLFASVFNPVVGLGSLAQGDGSSWLFIGPPILAGAIVMNAGGSWEQVVSGNPGSLSVNYQFQIKKPPVYYTGLTLLLAGVAYGLWAPWDFATKDNVKLRTALNMN